MNALTGMSFAPISATFVPVSKKNIFARLMPSFRSPSREMQLAPLSRSNSKEAPQTSLSPAEQGWSIGQFTDEHSAVGAICHGYQAPKDF